MKKKNKLFIGGVVVLVLLVGLLVISQPFSIISATRVNVGIEGGKPIWTVFFTPRGADQELVFSATPIQLGKVPDGRGGEFLAKNGFSVKFKRELPTCTYSLTEVTRTGDLFLRNEKSYQLSNRFERSQVIEVIPNKGSSEKIDGFDTSAQLTFNDPDGTGSLFVETQGAFLSKTDCPTATDVAVVWNQATRRITGYREAVGIRNTINWERNFPTYGCEIKEGFTKLVCTDSLGGIGNVALTVKASAEYVDFIYIPPKLGKPKIDNIIKPSSLVEGQQNSIRVIVKNIGDNDGTFVVRLRSSDFSYFPSTQQIFIEKGRSEEILFNIVGKQVNADVSGNIEVEMCGIGEFVQQTCDRKTERIMIEDRPAIIPPVNPCGDGICSGNENFNTCRIDCREPDQCTGANEEYVNGQCQCKEEYEYIEDDLGRRFCDKKGSDIGLTPFIIIGIAIIIIGIMIYAFKGKKRRR